MGGILRTTFPPLNLLGHTPQGGSWIDICTLADVSQRDGTPEVLDGSQRILIKKAIRKVQTNPLPETEGGYRKRLGNKNGTKLSGFLKIKLRGSGLRVVYQLVRKENHMMIIMIGARSDEEVCDIAHRRIQSHRL